MASEARVKEYLACWFQLGKAVVLNGSTTTILPQPVFQGDRYSPAFERCWYDIILPYRDHCVLTGTHQTIGELLSPTWDIDRCARCTMPSPQREQGMPPPTCPCADLPDWPNLDLPVPHGPADNQAHLGKIRDRLQANHPHEDPPAPGKPATPGRAEPAPKVAADPSPGLPYALGLQRQKQAQPQPGPKPPTPGYYALPTEPPPASDLPASIPLEQNRRASDE